MIDSRSTIGRSYGIADPTTLGAIIRAVRIGAGLTQHDAAELCGVSAPFLNGVERGKPTAQIGPILMVCTALGIRLEAAGPSPLPTDLASIPRRKPRRRKKL